MSSMDHFLVSGDSFGEFNLVSWLDDYESTLPNVEVDTLVEMGTGLESTQQEKLETVSSTETAAVNVKEGGKVRQKAKTSKRKTTSKQAPLSSTTTSASQTEAVLSTKRNAAKLANQAIKLQSNGSALETSVMAQQQAYATLQKAKTTPVPEPQKDNGALSVVEMLKLSADQTDIALASIIPHASPLPKPTATSASCCNLHEIQVEIHPQPSVGAIKHLPVALPATPILPEQPIVQSVYFQPPEIAFAEGEHVDPFKEVEKGGVDLQSIEVCPPTGGQVESDCEFSSDSVEIKKKRAPKSLLPTLERVENACTNYQHTLTQEVTEVFNCAFKSHGVDIHVPELNGYKAGVMARCSEVLESFVAHGKAIANLGMYLKKCPFPPSATVISLPAPHPLNEVTDVKISNALKRKRVQEEGEFIKSSHKAVVDNLATPPPTKAAKIVEKWDSKKTADLFSNYAYLVAQGVKELPKVNSQEEFEGVFPTGSKKRANVVKLISVYCAKENSFTAMKNHGNITDQVAQENINKLVNMTNQWLQEVGFAK